MKIRPVGVELFHADRREEVNSWSRNCANAPRSTDISSANVTFLYVHYSHVQTCIFPELVYYLQGT
jgi:hypothetical protein